MMKHKRNKQIPTDKRRIRRTLGYVSETCVEEKIKLDTAKQHKKLKKGIYSKTNPIVIVFTRFLHYFYYYFPCRLPILKDKPAYT